MDVYGCVGCGRESVGVTGVWRFVCVKCRGVGEGMG